jgi:hypothetical protein
VGLGLLILALRLAALAQWLDVPTPDLFRGGGLGQTAGLVLLIAAPAIALGFTLRCSRRGVMLAYWCSTLKTEGSGGRPT